MIAADVQALFDSIVVRHGGTGLRAHRGNVYLVEGAWNSDYIDELCMFPAGILKDQVDASSGAFGRLPKTKAEPIFVVPPAIPGRPRDVPPGGTAATSWSGRPERGGGGAP